MAGVRIDVVRVQKLSAWPARILPERSVGTRITSAGRLHGVNLSGDERRARRDAYETPIGEGTIVGDIVASSVSMNQACHILGKAIGDTSRMLRAIEPIDTYGAHKRRVRWPRAEVVRIADLLLHRQPIDAFSHRSGIPHYGIEQMICLGIVEQLDDPAILAGHKVRQLDGRSVRTLADRLASARVEGRPQDWLPLSEAMKGVGGREKPWGPAFTMMLGGKTVPFALLDGTDPADVAVDRILVPPAAGDALRAADFLRSDYPRFTFDEHLTVRDTAALLNVSDNKFTTIRREHFAKAVAADGRIAVGAVVEAARRWVSPGELGARTGRTPHDCFTELARTPLPRSLLGWPREAAEGKLNLTAGARR